MTLSAVIDTVELWPYIFFFLSKLYAARDDIKVARRRHVL